MDFISVKFLFGFRLAWVLSNITPLLSIHIRVIKTPAAILHFPRQSGDCMADSSASPKLAKITAVSLPRISTRLHPLAVVGRP